MRLSTAALAALALWTSAVAQDETRVVRLVGQALDRKTGELLYTENHAQQFRGGKLVSDRVEYRWPDGRSFAVKTVRYGDHPYAPDFRLDDSRDGYFEGAEKTGDRYEMYRKHGDQTQRKSIAWSDTLVADAGFDCMVKARLPELLAARGASVQVELAVAGRLASLGFRVVTEQIDPQRRVVELRAEADSLLRLIVPAIELAYATDTRELLRYVGLSNIRNSSGELYDTRIEFPRDDGRALPPTCG